MLTVIYENLGSILVLLGLSAILGLVIWLTVRGRRRGRSSCGCGCDSCAARGVCHSQKKK
jgi:hypothetical protein